MARSLRCRAARGGIPPDCFASAPPLRSSSAQGGPMSCADTSSRPTSTRPNRSRANHGAVSAAKSRTRETAPLTCAGYTWIICRLQPLAFSARRPVIPRRSVPARTAAARPIDQGAPMRVTDARNPSGLSGSTGTWSAMHRRGATSGEAVMHRAPKLQDSAAPPRTGRNAERSASTTAASFESLARLEPARRVCVTAKLGA